MLFEAVMLSLYTDTIRFDFLQIGFKNSFYDASFALNKLKNISLNEGAQLIHVPWLLISNAFDRVNQGALQCKLMEKKLHKFIRPIAILFDSFSTCKRVKRWSESFSIM